MSALLASSFVGRVAAFKATKIQVRIFLARDARRDARRRDARRRGDAMGPRDGCHRATAATRRGTRARRSDGANDGARARGEMIWIGRATREGETRAWDARDARDTPFVGFPYLYLVGISLGFGDSRGGVGVES